MGDVKTEFCIVCVHTHAHTRAHTRAHMRAHTHISLVAQLVKNLPAVQETWIQSLGWEDPLEKGKATHSSILPWRIPGTL